MAANSGLRKCLDMVCLRTRSAAPRASAGTGGEQNAIQRLRPTSKHPKMRRYRARWTMRESIGAYQEASARRKARVQKLVWQTGAGPPRATGTTKSTLLLKCTRVTMARYRSSGWASVDSLTWNWAAGRQRGIALLDVPVLRIGPIGDVRHLPLQFIHIVGPDLAREWGGEGGSDPGKFSIDFMRTEKSDHFTLPGFSPMIMGDSVKLIHRDDEFIDHSQRFKNINSGNLAVSVHC